MAFIVSVTMYSPQSITLVNVSAVVSILKIFFDVQMSFPWTLGVLADISVSINRVEEFLLAPELESDRIEDCKDSKNAVEVEHGYFAWAKEETADEAKDKKKSSKKDKKGEAVSDNSLSQSLLDGSLSDIAASKYAFSLEDVSLTVSKGSLVFIIGKIGSGKSSLLYALAGELPPLPNYPKVCRSGSVGLLSQHPWLLASSIKANILLDSPLDEARLNNAVRLSQLEDDLLELPSGLETFVGESGSNVSGGQRTRIAIARCIYQNPDILILDDPLSALDLKVADRLLKDAICGSLKDKTRIISTHSVHHLQYADKVVVVEDGRVTFVGKPSELENSEVYREFREVTQSYDVEDLAQDSKNKDEEFV